MTFNNIKLDGRALHGRGRRFNPYSAHQYHQTLS
jgi:hypothetical protein